MLSFVAKRYLLALAALPCVSLVSRASPAQIQSRASHDLLFAKGGPSLDDIAIKGGLDTRRSEEASIFAQCLIALVKLNPKNTVTLWFNEPVGEADVVITDTKVKPYYIGDVDTDKEIPEVPVSRDQAQQAADQAGEHIDDMKFGYTDDSAWWPYAVFTGAVKAGWDRHNNEALTPGLLAEQTLTILSGYDASITPPEIFFDYLKRLEDADHTPFILEIAEFDPANEDLKKRRWEKWITVMAYDDSTKLLDYATSFYDGDGGITEKGVNIQDIKILNIVRLTAGNAFDGQRAPKYQQTADDIPAPAATTSVCFGHSDC